MFNWHICIHVHVHVSPCVSQECANYMVDGAKGEKVRHAMSALLVDILTPVAAVIKYEMSMPAVKKLVSTLYSHFYDQSKKPRHSTVRREPIICCWIIGMFYACILFLEPST